MILLATVGTVQIVLLGHKAVWRGAKPGQPKWLGSALACLLSRFIPDSWWIMHQNQVKYNGPILAGHNGLKLSWVQLTELILSPNLTLHPQRQAEFSDCACVGHIWARSHLILWGQNTAECANIKFQAARLDWLNCLFFLRAALSAVWDFSTL